MAVRVAGDELPCEVVSHLMSFLPLRDRISASATCRQWYEASRAPQLHVREVVFVHTSRAIKDLCPEAVVLPDTLEVEPVWPPPPFQNFCFRELEVRTTGEMRHFWPRFGRRILRLSLQNCEVSEKAFNDILAQCPNLRYLHLSGCNELYMSGKVLESCQGTLRLEALEELQLTNTRYISDCIFNRFVALAPNLRRVALLGCNITCSSAVFGRFYPEPRAQQLRNQLAQGVIPVDVAAANVFTFENVLGVLSVRKVTSLGVGVTSLAFDNLNDLCQRLHSVRALDLRKCFQLVKGLDRVADAFATTLTDLDLSDCSFLTSVDLRHLGKLIALRRLNLNGCKNVDGEVAHELRNLSKLELLDLSNNERVLGPILSQAMAAMTQLKHLYLNRLALLDSDSLLQIVKQAPPLITLEMAGCVLPLIDAVLAVVCTRHTTIKRLNLANCPFVTDAGLTGLSENPELECPPAYQNTLMDVLPHCGVSLGSKAERQIVYEAKRKKQLAVHLTPLKETMLQQGICNLTDLSSLDLSNCSRVSDLSVRNVFRFNQLRFLSLERNCQITDSSIQSLVMHCPSIEELNVQDCGQLTNLGVSYLSHLQRLRELNLNGCDFLGDASLEALMTGKGPLRNVSLQRCSKLTPNAVNIFCNWLSHSINWSMPQNKQQSWCMPPPPPHLPSFIDADC
ncbi:Hypothetical predicted protein [Cloeon dipterum]|uniref:F-box domain-containing protein n=1 Tax=Cloeon dipterum TaxID=197152 RepID=A0A8S1CSS5_9INSE|nr:Hypothetical predicted protein [Cloeon dipterum]